MSAPQIEGYITAKAGAALLGVSTRTFREFVKRGKIPRYEITATRCVYKRDEIIRCLETRCKKVGR